MTREILITDLPLDCIMDCSTPGQAADDDVYFWRRDPAVAKILDALNSDTVRRGLKGYGAWDEDELADDEQNRHRVLWLACGNFREYIEECKEQGIDPFGERPEDFDPSCGSDLFTLE
jgi:hypothetical protein